MGAPKGNKFWEKRSTHGRKPIFESDEDLKKCCLEYFDWCHENPLYEMKAFLSNGEILQEPLYKIRAYTIGGLCIFLDIDQTTWGDWRTKDDFSLVIGQIEAIIRDQKFTGASAGLLNASIIARDLGLKEATQNEISGPDGTPIKVQEIIFNPVGNEHTSKD